MPLYIPTNCTSTDIKDVLRAFMEEFLKNIRELDLNAWGPDAFYIKYLSGKGLYKNGEIAAQLRTSVVPERVRQVLEGYTTGIKDMMDGTEYEGMLPSKAMQDAFNTLLHELKPVENFDLLLLRYGFGDKDKGILRCILDCLDYDITGGKDIPPYAISRKKFGRSLTDLKKQISPLSKFLRNRPFPCCYETDVLPFMINKKWSEELQKLMTEFLKMNEHEYEWFSPDQYGYIWVAKRWEALGGVDKRVIRILYDYSKTNNNTDGWINLDDIRKDYDHRADIHRLPHLDLNPTLSDEYKERRGGGDYRFSENPKKTNIDLRAELRSYVAQKGGICSLADVLAFANTKKSCSESTLDRYLRENGCVRGHMNEETYYCREDCKDKYPNFVSKPPVPQVTANEAIGISRDILIKANNNSLQIFNELVPLFEKQTGKQGINKVSFRNLLKKAEGRLFTFQQGSMISLYIPPDEAEEFDVDSVFPVRRKTREEFVQEVAAEKLLAAPNYTMTKKALREAVIQEGAFAKGVNVTNLYKYFKNKLFDDDGKREGGKYTLNLKEYNKRFGFDETFNWDTLKHQIISLVNDTRLDDAVADKMYSIMENVSIKPFGNTSEMWRILNSVNKYINGKPTANDKELLVFKLHIGLELYLKQYGGDHYSQEGLHTYIVSLQQNGLFPQYIKYGYTPGSIEYDINALTAKMISLRNKICHKLNERYNHDLFYKERIEENLKYYLLIAAYAMSHGKSN